MNSACHEAKRRDGITRASEANHPHRITKLTKVRLPSKRQRCGGDGDGDDGDKVQRSVVKPGSTSSAGEECITLAFPLRSSSQSTPRRQHRVSECLALTLRFTIAQARLETMHGQLSVRYATQRSTIRLEQHLSTTPARRTLKRRGGRHEVQCSLHSALPSGVGRAARKRYGSLPAIDFFVRLGRDTRSSHVTMSPFTSRIHLRHCQE
jgi:hypothetical protein